MPTNIVRFQILTVVVGLCIDKAVGIILHNPTPLTILSAVYFFVTLLNFYHGKIAATEDDAYRTVNTGFPLSSISDYFLNSLLIINFLIIAYSLDTFTQFIIANITMRLIDCVLVAHGIWVANRFKEKLPRHFAAEVYWEAFNAFTIAVMLLVLYLLTHSHCTNILWMPVLLILLSVLDVILDYSLNKSFYFGPPAQP